MKCYTPNIGDTITIDGIVRKIENIVYQPGFILSNYTIYCCGNHFSPDYLIKHSNIKHWASYYPFGRWIIEQRDIKINEILNN